MRQSTRDLSLGERVTVSRVMTREWTGATYSRRAWVSQDLPEPVEGIVTGIRTLSNGYWHTDYTEYGASEGSYYVREEAVPAIHVVVHLRQKPLIVPLDGFRREVTC